MMHVVLCSFAMSLNSIQSAGKTWANVNTV